MDKQEQVELLYKASSFLAAAATILDQVALVQGNELPPYAQLGETIREMYRPNSDLFNWSVYTGMGRFEKDDPVSQANAGASRERAEEEARIYAHLNRTMSPDKRTLILGYVRSPRCTTEQATDIVQELLSVSRAMAAAYVRVANAGAGQAVSDETL